MKEEKARSDALVQRMTVLLSCFPFKGGAEGQQQQQQAAQATRAANQRYLKRAPGCLPQGQSSIATSPPRAEKTKQNDICVRVSESFRELCVGRAPHLCMEWQKSSSSLLVCSSTHAPRFSFESDRLSTRVSPQSVNRFPTAATASGSLHSFGGNEIGERSGRLEDVVPNPGGGKVHVCG